MKKYNLFFAVMLSMVLLFSVSAFAKHGGVPISQTGYDLELNPGVNLTDNSNGTHTIFDTFELYNNGLNNQDLTSADFSVYENGNPVPATIVPPGTSTLQQKADIIFCMDISGSMGSEINAVKSNTQGFVDALNQRNFDVQLGLITFGGSPYLKPMNSEQFYASTGDFLTDFNTLRARGWNEPWFDANVKASQYSFRQGAARVIILITDENGNNAAHNISSSITAVNNNASTIYSITYPRLRNPVRAAVETGGKVYNIIDPFADILNDIARQIANRYSVSYLSSAQPGIHELKVKIAQNGNFDIAHFKIGANPVVTLTQATLDMIQNGVAPDGSMLTIGAEVTDDGNVVSVNIYGTDAGGAGYAGSMTMTANVNDYTYDIAAPTAPGTCFDFTIKAIDDEGRVTISGPFSICASADPPVIGTVTPDEYDYNTAIPVTADVTDPDSDLSDVTLEARNHGTLNWSTPLAMSGSGSTYSASLDAAYAAGFGGVDLRITAIDLQGNSAVVEKTITVKSIPVTIIDVTTHRDIIDKDGDGEGSFSVYAVVAGVDLTITGNSVTLFYTVDGGAASLVDMTQTVVTAGQASLAANSNIYFAEIPVQNPGVKICYYVEAENPSPDSATSAEKCFDILQPADPLAVTPAYAVVTPGEEVSFVAAGGYGTYSWKSLNGTLSTTLGDTCTYTAGIVGDGWDKVAVTDLRGFTTTAKIRVLPSLAINPDVSGRKFSPSSTVILTAMGGEPDYTWDVTNAVSSTVSDDATVVTIELGADPAEITVVLTDSKARSAKVVFTNNGELKLTPCCDVQVEPGAEESFSVTGGLEPYVWTVQGGDLDSYSAADVTYQAPELPGIYHITVEDANGDSATAKIQVGTPLRVTPCFARILRSESQTFKVVSGVPPYTWMVEYGTLSATSGDTVIFTPEDHLGVYTVTVIDGVESMEVMTVEVSEGLVVTPSIAQVEKGNTKTFTVNGGQGGYTWSAIRGTVSPIDGQEVVYTAPDNLGDGKDTLEVRDIAGNTAAVDITITEGSLDDLTITPFEATLAPGGIIDFVVNNAKDLDKILWTATKGTIAQNGTYTAPDSSGTYTVSVTDILNGRTADARVFVTSSLALTPDSATVAANDTKTFTVSGGEAPYNWRVVGEGDLNATTGGSVTFTAAAKSGTSTLIVIDNTGKKAEAEIEITGTIVITPASVTLAPLGTITFSVPGVSGDLKWTALRGTIDDNGGYTAPADLGVDTITAEDDAGNEATATVTVGNIPVITPAMVWVVKSGMTSFDVVGGTPPYSWSVTGGNISVTGTSASYTAPGVSGEYTVTVKDSLGQESQAVVYVELDLKATRAEIYVKPGETARVAVTGGIPPFDWGTVTGDMEVVSTQNAGYNYYTAPDVMGEDTITIRDSKDSTTTVTVHVTQPLMVTPNVRYIEREESKTFTAVSGVAPYTAVVMDGDGDISPVNSDDGIFTFTAGTTADDDVVIKITDNSGQEVEVHAYVETSLKVTPGTIYVDRNANAVFRVSGGTGGYEVIATSGSAEVDSETGEGNYTAPGRNGTYTITVFDSKDQSLDIAVDVSKTDPVISPSIVHMDGGETRTFMVNMGAPPYDWSFTGGLVNTLDGDGTTAEIIAPEVSGTYTLTIDDAAGNSAEAEVIISLPLLISPSSMTVYQGTSPSLRISALGGIGPYQWSSTETAIEEYDGFAVVRPETRVEAGQIYTVQCRDSEGAIASMNVIVSRMPGDLDGDGELSGDEMLNVINSYIEDAAVQGITLDVEKVYSLVNAFLTGGTPAE